MSIDLTAEREWVSEILTGLDLANVFAYLPARTPTPALMVMPGSPYLIGGQTFGSLRVAFRVVFISHNGVNVEETAEVDTAVAAAINAFLDNGIAIDGATTPYAINMNNGTFLAADINISYQVRN